MNEHQATEATIERFFDRAAEIEPPDLPTAGQLRWRAEIAARMTADEHRAAVIRRPVLAGLCLAFVPVLSALILVLAGIVPSEAVVPSGSLVTSPLLPVGLLLAGLGLVAVLSLLARPRSRVR